MDRIVRKTEGAPLERAPRALPTPTTQDAIAHAAVTTAEHLGAKAIIALTNSGGTARLVSKYRPRMPILGATPIPRAVGQLSLLWGVAPLSVATHTTEEALLADCFAAAKAKGLLAPGDTVVVTSGQLGVTGTTDRVRVRAVP
jgi:pyruvate kinase